MPTEKKGSNFKQDRDRNGKAKAVAKGVGKGVGKALENSVLNSGYAMGKMADTVMKENLETVKQTNKKAFEIGGQVRAQGSFVEGMNEKPGKENKRGWAEDPAGNLVKSKEKKYGTKVITKFGKDERPSVGKRRQVDKYRTKK